MARELTIKCGSDNLNKHASKSIFVWNRLIEFIPTMIEVAKKFDGKLINKRLLTAFEKASPKYTDYYGRERKEFSFHFYDKSLKVCFCGKINDEIINYNTNIVREVTFYGYDMILNTKFDFSKFERIALSAIEVLNQRINTQIKYVENFDRVNKIYEQAYNLLKEVVDYKECCYYIDDKHTAMRYLTDVYVSKY